MKWVAGWESWALLEVSRYQRQILLPQIGEIGQAKLEKARVVLIGCGALGGGLAEQLVRAGVGWLRLIDRDVVELTNLQRQVLFDEADSQSGTPKAIAAARRLANVNSTVKVEPIVADFHAGNAEALAGIVGERPDLILDGTDNAETRYLINDLCVKHGVPWVYGAVVGAEGRVLAMRPPQTPCLRCIFEQPPGPGELPTCDTVGVLGPAAAVVAGLQAAAAIRLIVGNMHELETELLTLDLWTNRFHSMSIDGAKRSDCPACGKRFFEFLDRRSGNGVSLCGQNAVQVRPPSTNVLLDLDRIADRLGGVGEVTRTPHLLRCSLHTDATIRLVLFPDGRLIVHGTNSLERAKSVYARYIGV